ncbi:SRPBCC family protein [Micromonospora vinacea]|uniref:SRPBCC family protein n=1 Tax=Micromonospora vinacea TaxID=709878 RepID=UPI003456BF52
MAGHTDNAVVINAPFDLVWDLTNDIPNWPSLFSEYATTEVLSTSADGAVVFRLTMHPDPAGRVWSWVSERVPDRADGVVRSRRLETGAFKYMNLFWEYTEIPDGGVRMRWVQDFEMRPGGHTDDEGMTAHLNRTTREQQARIREIVEKAAAERGQS